MIKTLAAIGFGSALMLAPALALADDAAPAAAPLPPRWRPSRCIIITIITTITVMHRCDVIITSCITT